jgi:hypothetical protein
MPKVPTYDNFQASSSSLPQTRIAAPVMPDVAGQQAQQMGQGLMQAGAAMSRYALDRQNEANQIKLNEAMNKAAEAKLRLTYDPEAGYANLRGDAAMTRPDNKALDDEYSEKLNEALTGIETGLGNDAQKQAFRARAGQLVAEFRGNVTRHLSKEFTDYQLSVHDGTIATQTNAMGLSWGDAAEVMRSRGAILAATAAKGKMMGLAGVQIEQLQIAALSPGHTAVIAGAVDGGKIEYAREYLKQHEAELSNEARLRAKSLVEQGDFETKTQDAADSLYQQSGGDAASALKLAREKYTGKEEDAIVTRLKTLAAEETTLRERGQRDAADAAWGMYADGKRIPPSVWAELDGRDKIALRKTMRAEAEARAAGTTVKTDPNVYYALSIAAATDPNFKSEDLRRYGDKLSPGDFKRFVDLQAKSNKPEEQGAIVTINTQKTQTARAAGLKPEQAAQFYIEADKALGPDAKNMSYEQRQTALDRLVMPGEVKGGLYDPNMRNFEARQSGRGDTFTPFYSDADRRKAKAALQKAGVATPSKKQVEDTMKRAYGFTD